ncbi:MAG TPA: alpha/beta hydrolase [Rhizomicrobium sp.]|jgi:pimeloyl-ACP methyl ester carboxylesterase
MAQFLSGDVSIAYDDVGTGGRPVILVHGFASNRNENWRRTGWYGAFERRRVRLVALDNRGHGESGKPHDASAYGRTMMTGDIFALMDHLGVQRADLLGYSMGARLALAAALAKPERFGDLILGGIGGALFDPPPPGTPMADAMKAPTIDAITEPLLKSFRQFADEQGEDRLALAACSEGRDTNFTPDEVSRLAVHTLVVAGARDQLAGDPEELAAIIPGAKAVTLPGCDHFSAIPHALFKAAVFDFLDGEMG